MVNKNQTWLLKVNYLVSPIYFLDIKHLVGLVQTGNFQEVVKLNNWIFGTEQLPVKESVETFLKNSHSNETRYVGIKSIIFILIISI